MAGIILLRVSIRKGRKEICLDSKIMLTHYSTEESQRQRMPRHIGIVAVSAEGAALCYRTICAEGAALFGRHTHPEISIHTYPLAEYMRHIEADRWQDVASMLLSSAAKLHQAGAELLICPDNTVHQGLDLIGDRSPLPWLHIAEVVADEASNHGYKQLGLLGTRWLVESEVYPQKLAERGITCIRPTEDERREINRIIMDELVYGVFRPESVTSHQLVIRRMKDEGCDAVVLGCTEIPLIISNKNSPLPVLDSTRLLAWAALNRAVGVKTLGSAFSRSDTR
jgi:aspartate racemase